MEKLLANEIREHLKLHLGGRKFLSEFTFSHNGTIADLLDINHQLIGYEIKSDSDTYARLPKQIEGYNSVCRQIYMVVGESKSTSVFLHVPEFYGVVVVKRQDNGLVVFDVVREAGDNPHWNTRSLLYWLPSEHLKRLAKTNSDILALYGGKKTPINKLPKSKVVELIVQRINSAKIEHVVLRYLRSDELSARRLEARRINNSMKNYDSRMRERERTYRLGNWSYFKEDLRQILNYDESSRVVRLHSIGRNYLPLSVEYNPKGVHNGYFAYNGTTKTIDFHLKDSNVDDTACVPDVLGNEQFLKFLHIALAQNFSCAQLRFLINDYINK